jgi:hypothetical protein
MFRLSLPSDTDHGPVRSRAAAAWRRRAGVAALSVAAMQSASAQAPAADDGVAALSPLAQSNWRFNGFGTLAAANTSSSSDWGFAREATQPQRRGNGTSLGVDSRLGLQADWRLDAQWELVGQLVFKPRVHGTELADNIAWAFAAWHPSPDWTVRAGRTSPDLFLLADVRNVGFAYPWIRPSVDFYGWMPLSKVDGLDVSRQFDLGESRWRAKLFAGRSSFRLGSARLADDSGKTNPLMGGTLTGEDGRLTVKATFAVARTRATNARSIDQLHAALDGLSELPVGSIATQAAELRDTFPLGTLITRYSALAVVWDASPWQLQAELARTTGNFRASQVWYGYASAAYRVGDVTPFAMFGRARSSRAPLADAQWAPTLAPVVGAQTAALAQQAGQSVVDTFNYSRIDQRTICVGTRWDVAERTTLKFQVDLVRSASYGGGLWAYDDLGAHHARVTSLGMDFVF